MPSVCFAAASARDEHETPIHTRPVVGREFIEEEEHSKE
jgi:hypothetical protein